MSEAETNFRPNKYEINYDFFKTWSPEMAYVAGVYAADGSLLKKSENSYVLSLRIKDTDAEWLENIRCLMGYGGPIVYTQSRNFRSADLMIGATRFRNDLIKIGIVPQKSLILEWTNIPNEFASHFARGYVDGDGCVRTYESKKSPNKQLTFKIVGTPIFLYNIKFAYSLDTQDTRGNLHQRDLEKNFATLEFKGTKLPLQFGRWLYRDSTPQTRLARKYDIYQSYVDDWGYLENEPRGHFVMNAADSRTAKLTWEQVHQIRLDYTGGITQKQLAVQYGITSTTMSLLLRNKIWRENLETPSLSS